MIQTRLICSKSYALKLNPNLSEEDWMNLVEVGRRFEPLYQQKMPFVLEFIPLYTGKKWESKLYIPIYLGEYPGPSKSNPLTLKVDSDYSMLVKLIHELTHINFPCPIRVREEIYELAINQVTERIANKIGIKKCSALEEIVEYRNSLRSKGIQEEIDLDNFTLKKIF